MDVHRLIFRLDFKPNYAIMDSPGSVLRLIDGISEGFWNDLRDNKTTRELQGSFKSETESRILLVAPNTIHCSLEWLNGCDVKKLEKEQNFQQILMVMKKLCEEFGVTALVRSGLRLFCFDSLYGSKSQVSESFSGMLDHNLSAGLEETLGKANDIGFAFDGDNLDDLSYHIKFGPYGKDREEGKYLKEFPAPISGDGGYDLVVDIDLYENDFDRPKVAFMKYLGPLIERATTVTNHLKERIKN